MGRDIEIVTKFLIERERRKQVEIERCRASRRMFVLAHQQDPEKSI